MKVTGGNWKVRNNSGKQYEFFIHNQPYSNWPIACKLSEGDAHIMAASKKLLAALEVLLSETSNIYNTSKSLAEAEENARLAIAKAVAGDDNET